MSLCFFHWFLMDRSESTLITIYICIVIMVKKYWFGWIRGYYCSNDMLGNSLKIGEIVYKLILINFCLVKKEKRNSSWKSNCERGRLEWSHWGSKESICGRCIRMTSNPKRLVISKMYLINMGHSPDGYAQMCFITMLILLPDTSIILIKVM